MPSVVAIVKDEGPYLAEWIIFHRLQGFDRFLIYDNGSADDSREVCERLHAEVIPWPGQIQQLPAYMDAIERRLPPDEWTAFIDVDEYLWCPDGRRVVDALPDTELAIGAPWVIYGDSGYEQRPSGLTIEAYVRRERGPNPHVKQILKPRHVRMFADPHHTNVPYVRSFEIEVAHYWTRSEAECREKFARGRADYHVKRRMEEFYAHRVPNNEVFDDRLARMWGPQLNAWLALDPLKF